MAPNSKRFPTAVGASVIASLVLSASASCSSGAIGTTLAAKQGLAFPMLVDVTTLDPAMANGEGEVNIAENLFDGLVEFDNNLALVPDIATSVPNPSADGLAYTFNLRHDVTFSNGDKVTSKDVLYSWNRAAAMQGSYALNLSPIDGYSTVANNQAIGSTLENLLEKNDPSVTMTGLTAPDQYTVQVRLSTPAGWFLPAIALPGATGMIVDENAVRQDFDNWWTIPATAIGTGPFRMTSRVPKQSMDFASVPNWWGSPKPSLTKIHADLAVMNASTAITKYEQGAYDIYGYAGSSSAPIADIVRIKSAPSERAQLLLEPQNKTTWVSFNLVSDSNRTAGGPFVLSDGQAGHDLRLAFALAIDKKKLAEIVCLNVACTPATGGLIPSGVIGYLGDNRDPLSAFSPTQAKSLFRLADPRGDKTKGLVYYYEPENPLNKPTAEFLQSQWSINLGVNLQIQPVEHHEFIKARLSGRYVLSRDAWGADYNHPQDWFDNLWGKLAGCPDSCTSGYDTKAYDTLLAKADTETGDQAVADYRRLSQMLIDDIVYIPLYYSVGAFLIKPYVKGAGTNAFYDFHWNAIRILSH